MKCYVGTKIICAEPAAHEDGRPGYTVLYPDGYASWSPKDTFEIAYREITFHERQLLEQTDAEHQVAAISDGECRGWIPGEYDLDNDVTKCARCGALQSAHEHQEPRSDMNVEHTADHRILDTAKKVDEWNQANVPNKAKLGDTVRIPR